MTTALVTGGAGFIGSNLCIVLLERGFSVRVLDSLVTGRKENLRGYEREIEMIRGDIRNRADVARAVKGAGVVFHQAALASVPQSVADPLLCNECNVTGTLNVLTAARDHGVRRVVYASSSAVYGDSEVLPKVETMGPGPMSPYAVSKLANEMYGRVFARLYGLETVGLRYFNVFGPRQDPNSQYAAVIPKFVRALRKGKQPVIYGDGEQSRDFVSISDVVEANILAATAPGVGGEVFNIAYGRRTTLNALLGMLAGIIGSDVEAVYTDPRPGDVRHSLADIDKARRLLGYNPRVEIEEGLRRTVRWFGGVG